MPVSNFEVSLKGKTIVAPLMGRATTHTMAAGIGGVLDTTVSILPSGEQSNIETGKRFSSGRECYPYIVTLSDILTFFRKEKERRGCLDSYVLIYPQAHGPCRFGQYHTAIDMVLRREGFEEVLIVSPTTKDSYTLGGQITRDEGRALRVVLWNSIVAGDILNRLVRRSRPYEKETGLADSLYEKALSKLCETLHDYAGGKTNLFSSFAPVKILLRDLAEEFKAIIDSTVPRKPLVGIIGEIYLRMHEQSNRQLVRRLEEFGCETVTASLAEWINYTTFVRLHESRRKGKTVLAPSLLNDRVVYGITAKYQYARMQRLYNSVSGNIDIPVDHTIPHLFAHLDGDYSPDLTGEAILSIAAAKTWFSEGYHGIVNAMPFGCMPSNNADWILSNQKAFEEVGFPYLPLVFDDAENPTMEPMMALFAEKAKRYKEKP